MNRADRAYRRAILAYPRAWRREHGEVMLGTLLDAAEAAGRVVPTLRELASLVAHGLGERLNRRSARALCLMAAIFAATGSVLSFSPGLGTEPWPTLLSIFAAPVLLSAALAGLLRETGILSHLHALAGIVLALPAWALSSGAAWSWSIGFDQADQGLPLSPLAEAFLTLFLASWAIGSAAGALVISVLLRLASVTVVPRIVFSVIGGALAAPMLALMAVMPFGSVGMAVGLLLCVLLNGRTALPRTAAQAPTAVPTVITVRAPTALERMRMLSSAWFAILLGLPAAAYALTGSIWMSAGPDATETMRIGMALGLLASTPLVINVGRFLESRRTARGPFAASPTLAAAVSLLVAAGSQGLHAIPDTQFWVLLLSVAIGAYAAGRTAFLAGFGAPSNRILMACALGAGYACFPGMMVATAGAFAAPIAGLFALFWIRRSTVPRNVLVHA